MLFSSPVFLFLFLPLALSGYFLFSSRSRNAFLLAASLFFYAWGEAYYVIVMTGSIGINYFFGLAISNQLRQPFQKNSPPYVLFAGIACNLLLLFYFKYAGFFLDNVNFILARMTLPQILLSPIHLPIGISFFTFQAMSYLVDIHRKEAKPQQNVINCALYISLFPQLIAGPIVRYHHIAGQIVDRTVTIQQFSSGVQRFIFGLSKKVIIANTLGRVADDIFAIPCNELTTSVAWLGGACYSLQIYF